MTREVRVPKDHRFCNHCGGNGKDSLRSRAKCPVCRGKGFWNAEDIRLYHLSAPDLCKQTCGEKHRGPSFLDPDVALKQLWDDLDALKIKIAKGQS